MMKYSKNDIVSMLSAEGDAEKQLFDSSAAVKHDVVGNVTYLRGLIEYSNVCAKNCLYCGIRRGNGDVHRYTLNQQDILDAAQFAYENSYGSVVIQGGEIATKANTANIESILHKIKELSDGKLGVTLSLGEQSLDTYKRWFNAGAHRYLLRIESSNRQLYSRLHPADSLHDYDTRVKALYALRDAGYQLGTGVMIGLPFQTLDDLADDILFFNDLDIDMCGMGPYVEHRQTPLYEYHTLLKPLLWRMNMTFKMIAALRITMPTINIAATTALEAIDAQGRTMALRVGANVLMPNITSSKVLDNYKLYEGKPNPGDDINVYAAAIERLVMSAGDRVGYGEWGDSLHFVGKD